MNTHVRLGISASFEARTCKRSWVRRGQSGRVRFPRHCRRSRRERNEFRGVSLNDGNRPRWCLAASSFLFVESGDRNLTANGLRILARVARACGSAWNQSQSIFNLTEITAASRDRCTESDCLRTGVEEEDKAFRPVWRFADAAAFSFGIRFYPRSCLRCIAP
jgi:hypothetical protein